MTQMRRTMTCPACGEPARVRITALPAEQGTQRFRVDRFSCPKHDLVTERSVLQALGLANLTTA